jgi:DNA-binding NarL/FixJ family response regulator
MKIFIVEDSAIMRGRLIELLSTLREAEITGFSGIAYEAIEMIRAIRPDVVVLDIQLYGGSGIEVLKKVKEEFPCMNVMVLTNFPEEAIRLQCSDLGADYFLDKSFEFDIILDAILSMVGNMKESKKQSQQSSGHYN